MKIRSIGARSKNRSIPEAKRRDNAPAMEVLVHIGYPKTGTTWLQRELFPMFGGWKYLKSSVVARPSRLDREIFDCIWRDDADYMESVVRAFLRQRGRGGGLLVSHESMCGHPWRGGTDRDRTLDRLFRLVPEAVILVTIREQSALLRSLYAQYVDEGGSESFSRFVRGEAEGCAFDLDYLDFARLVTAAEDRFSTVVVETAERIRTDPQSLVERLSKHTSLASDVVARQGVAHRSLTRPSRTILRIWNRFFRRSPFKSYPPIRLPLRATRTVRRVLSDHADTTLFRATSRRMAKADEVLLSELAVRFRESNRRLADHTGLDLVKWGYLEG